MALRELLAAVLSVGLGLVFLTYPAAVIRIQTAGRYPTGRRGEYGTDGEPPEQWQLLVRVIGVLAILAGLAIATGFIS